MEPTPADTVKTAIQQALTQALANDDPVHRIRAITAILDAIKDCGPMLKDPREADVLKLRETLTLREVSERTGLSIPRIDQIAKAGRAKKAAEREQSGAP